MKNRVCYLAPALAALLVHLTFSAHAFTLGNLRGAAVLGRPLDVTVQVQAGPDEVLSSTCVAADVFYADARQSAVKVTVVPITGASTGAAVRVQSTAAIDEPVITVEVRAHCGSNTLRRYVLLADFPALAATAAQAPVANALEAPPVLVLPATASAAPSVVVAPVKSARTNTSRSLTATTAQRQVKAKHLKTPALAVAQEQAQAQAQAHKAAARAASRPVLKLDPLDILSDRMDALDSLMLFAPTEDALRYSRQISALEGDVKTLRARAASNDAKLSDLASKLQQAQASQMPWWLVYALLALVLACLAAVAWLWQQRKHRAQHEAEPSWWHSPEDGPATELLARLVPTAPVPMPAPAVPPQPVTRVTPAAGVTPAPVKVAAAPLSEVDIDLDHVMQLVPVSEAFGDSRAGNSFGVNGIRHIQVEPILDIRQQADFFVSLGQTDRALFILRKQIAESVEPNPLVYLDLLTLYHAQGMKTEFRDCRDTFHQLFNGVIPDFPVFNVEGNDLEAYPEVLSALVARWPRIEALAFLSACIFYDANAQARGLFDLAAFRDLLLLHALAEALMPEQPATVEANLLEFSIPTAPQSSVQNQAKAAPVTAPIEGAVSRMLDLDFSDLSDFPGSTGNER
ncbi:MAG: hypothetical protein PHQ58_12135 [Rhodoferax sp.]|uniref:type IV pilus assembly protein FimV n=1 Tax=Rhodoferax sp. TaxID=50421 RepID=UPI002613E749|nr:hypothetical protein [Rhodoferax sp.]MDD2881175.1 hypothetical protein [Rhodoferax sp.]